MASAGIHNIVIEQGADFSKSMTYKDKAKVPIDLTNWTARMSIRDKFGGTLIISLTTENSRIALGDTSGTIILTITAADTTGLAAGTGVYDLELIDDVGKVRRLLKGAVAIFAEVTT